jgi:serine protease AprX
MRYAAKFGKARQATALHTQTDPPTTFPYHHEWQEEVFSQPERLPDYPTFTAQGVTVAFLDSGYYPHPDLLAASQWEGAQPRWERLSIDALQHTLQERPSRLVTYVDLTDGGERQGLDQSSLWDGAGDSWHGQMTTTIVAGNGLLSGGRYRGYAPAATLLPIKIGRGGGRIPEEDILGGLQWLLRDDNWARYGVRVLNISVGGDFLQPWHENPVALAAEALIERGVFIAAAAGNSGRAELRAPAAAPRVMTVGGVDDGNQPWARTMAQHCALYPHNYGSVNAAYRGTVAAGQLRKPELLALARWLPAPILPPSAIFREVATLGELRRLLLGHDPLNNRDFGWRADAATPHDSRFQPPTWMPEVWQGVRQRMNAHKWIHPFYQHVDGTSVSVAQVSAVAAQMVQANPALTPSQIRALLLQSALPLPVFPPHLTGAGLLQPWKAVALALRASGPLAETPLSATPLAPDRLAARQLPTWGAPGTGVAVVSAEASLGTIYLGCYAPEAERVSVVGAFNEWQPGRFVLAQHKAGWWHGAITLPKGQYAYRFWVESATVPNGQWLADPENGVTVESGYQTQHSLLEIK